MDLLLCSLIWPAPAGQWSSRRRLRLLLFCQGRPDPMSRAIGPPPPWRTGADPEIGDYCIFWTKWPPTYCCAHWPATPVAGWSRCRHRRLLEFLCFTAGSNEQSNSYLADSPESAWRGSRDPRLPVCDSMDPPPWNHRVLSVPGSRDPGWRGRRRPRLLPDNPGDRPPPGGPQSQPRGPPWLAVWMSAEDIQTGSSIPARLSVPARVERPPTAAIAFSEPWRERPFPAPPQTAVQCRRYVQPVLGGGPVYPGCRGTLGTAGYAGQAYPVPAR